MMKRSVLIFPLLITGAVFGAEDSRYERWLKEEVVWIIGAEEKKEFESLESDEERESFIRRFWTLRDPSEDTAENEYREEYYRRLKLVNTQFREGNLPGWKTDRGRVFLIHGPPVSRRMEGDSELWAYPANPNARYYQGAISLVFERGGSTYQARALSESRMGQQQLEVYEQRGRNTTVPTVQSPRFRLVSAGPGLGSGGAIRTSSGETDRYIADLFRSPGDVLDERRKDESRRMEIWKELTGQVSSEVTFGKLECDLQASAFNRGDEAFVFFLVEVDSGQLDFEDVGDKSKEARADFFCEIVDSEDGYQVDLLDGTKRLPDTSLKDNQKIGMTDRFRVPPGEYNVRCLVQDVSSRRVGEEQAKLSILPPNEARPVLSSLLLTQRIEPLPPEAETSDSDLLFQQLRFPHFSDRLINPQFPVYLFFEAYSAAETGPNETDSNEMDSNEMDSKLVFDYRMFNEQEVLLKVPVQPLAWQQETGRYTQALQFDFSNLPPGSYTFLVKVLDPEKRTFAQRMVEFTVIQKGPSG